jgi:hypothetical protein
MNSEIPKKKTKKIKKEKKRQKQKQKQKQNVKQSVEVKVQSSGGSSAGGGGGYVPSAFQDRTGENVRLQNILDVLQKSAKASVSAPAPVYVPPPAPKKSLFSLPSSNINIMSKPNIENESLLNRVVIAGNKAEDEMNLINDLEIERENAIAENNLNNAVKVGEEIDDADDKLNSINDDIQNFVEKAKRVRRTKEQIAIDNAKEFEDKLIKAQEKAQQKEMKAQAKKSKKEI